MQDSQEKEIHLLDYWRVLVKRRWVVYTTLSVLVTTVTLGSLLMPPVYTASTRLQIERSGPHILPFQELMGGLADQQNDFYQTQYGLIRSRSVVREVINSLHLDRHEEFQVKVPEDPGPGLTPEQVAETKRIGLFLQKLEVQPVRKSRLVDVIFSSHDRVLAARVANRLAETYIAFNTEARYNTSERATTSLEHQIANLQEEIDGKEKEFQKYAREHGIVQLTDKQNLVLKNLNDLQDAHTRAQANRIEKEAHFAAIREGVPEGIPEVLQSNLIQDLTAKSAELERKYAQLSEKYKPEWPEMVRLNREIEATRSRLVSERQAIYSQVVEVTRNAFLAARNEENNLARTVDDLKKEFQDLSLKEIKYNNLRAEIANRRQTLESLVQRQGETRSSIGLDDVGGGNIRIVDPAEIPTRSSSPKILFNIMLSILTGLSLGVGLVFFLEYLDKSVKTVEEFVKAAGVPCLGWIPFLRVEKTRLRLVRGNGEPSAEQKMRLAVDLVSHDNPKGNVSEAFRELRTSLLVSRPGGPPRTILITSSQMGEGKTVVALNLAITLAQMGRRVLLVDADLRKPRLHKLLVVPNDKGLSNILSGAGPLQLQPWGTSIPGLHLIPTGPLPPNPADLLDSERFVQLQREMEGKEYDHIIFDSPPILPVADAAILAGRVEAVLVVAWAGRTSREALEHSVKRLQQVKARIVGGILNRVDLKQHGYYYGYSYRNYYGEKETLPPDSQLQVRERDRRIPS